VTRWRAAVIAGLDLANPSPTRDLVKMAGWPDQAHA
jgi:hypothetical protein